MKTSSPKRFANRYVVLSLLAASVAWLAWPMVAKAEDITVANPSFETTGDKDKLGAWANVGTPWSVGTKTVYSENNVDNDGTHFGAAAHLSWLVHLSSPVSITQDLATVVNAGNVLSVTFSGGRAKDSSLYFAGGGVFNATFLVASTAYTESYDTRTQSENTWQSYTLTKTITNSGNLSLVFSTVSGYPGLDNISSVTRTVPPPSGTFIIIR